MSETDVPGRRWSLAAAIAAVAVFGMSVGQGGPLLSLILESRGVDATLNGLTAGSAFIGVVLGPLLAPRLVRGVGLRRFLLAGFAADIALFPLMRVFDTLPAWFVLRVLLGMVGSSIFTASEAWITMLAGTGSRGRVLGLYAAALSAGMGTGPLLLSVTGIEGWTPFLANGAITALAGVPLLAAGGAAGDLGREGGGNPLAMFLRAPVLLLAVAMFGLYEQALMTLLPVWGVRSGFGRAMAAATLSAVFLGAIVMQFPVGLFSDRIARLGAFRLCGLGGLAGAAVLAFVPLPPALLFGLLFLWGGVAAAIYPVALSMAGDRFQGSAMVAANAAMIIAYGLGSLAGPPLGGVALDLRGPAGLPELFVVLFAAFLLATLFARSGPRVVVRPAGP